MKIFNSISERFIPVTFGVLLALLILTQAAIVPDKKFDTQEQTDSEENEIQQITKPPAVPASSLQINLDYQSYLLAEVFYQDQKKEKAPAAKLILSATQKAFKIFFRRIISPNAP